MGKGHGSMWFSVPALAVLLAALAGCSSTSSPTPAVSRPAPHPSASATPAPTSVTVIAPLGVNLRTAPAASASVVGVVAQGVSLPIVSHTSSGGGWWEVKGSSQAGWITADLQYTSTLSFQTFASPGSSSWSVMYPQGWTFAQQTAGTVVLSGAVGDAITFVTAATTAQLPPAESPGSTQKGVGAVEVYGVTVPLVIYASTTSYEASVEFQAQPALAFLITAQLPAKTGAATLKLFLETVFFTVPATPSP